jgi:hypothetical protein
MSCLGNAEALQYELLQVWSLNTTINIVIYKLIELQAREMIDCNTSEWTKPIFQEQRIHTLITDNGYNIEGTLHDSCGYVSFFAAAVTHLNPYGFRWFIYGESAESRTHVALAGKQTIDMAAHAQ